MGLGQVRAGGGNPLPYICCGFAIFGAALFSGCGSTPVLGTGTHPALPDGVNPLDQTDQLGEHALAVALAGIASTTPQLDALAERTKLLTPELSLDVILGEANAALPPLRLRAGDLLEVMVYGREEFSGEQRVAQDGRIHMFLLGPIEVAGLTPEEASETLRTAFGRTAYLKQPQIYVQVMERAPAFVQVVGRVKKPGAVALPSAELLSLHDVFAHTEGFQPDADGDLLALIRDVDGERRCYHFTYGEMLTAHLAGREAWLEPDDQIVVPKLPQVYVAGYVKEPGPQPLRPGSKVGSLIGLAGGLTEEADSNALVALKGKSSRALRLTDKIQPGEVLFAPRRQRVYLVGAGVVTNGPLDLPRSGLTVVQAIAEAGWFTGHAKLSGVEILRYKNGQQQRIECPVDDILDGERSESEFRLQPGDLVFVPESIW
jgi:protein involved in polysaccharide export with SLBB domain